MATELELRERQKVLLGALLRLKKQNSDNMIGLDVEIAHAIIGMLEEDVAMVEKLTGAKV